MISAVACRKVGIVLLFVSLAGVDARKLQKDAPRDADLSKVLAKLLLEQSSEAAFAYGPGVAGPRNTKLDAQKRLGRRVPAMTASHEEPSATPVGTLKEESQPERSPRNPINAMMRKARALRSRVAGNVMTDAEKKKAGLDIGLFVCVALWYFGNYQFNINNKLALNAAGGAAGFPISIAASQLGVGVVYAIFLWLAPDARPRPTITFQDWLKTLPVGFHSAAAHAATVFAMSAGAVSFAQIVKAAEPAFAALVGTLLYSATVSKAKWLALIPVIGGVGMASLGELDFAWSALITASLANIFASFRGNENKKLMGSPGIKDRLGSVGNQFAVAHINSFLFLLPLVFILEGSKFGQYLTLLTTNPVVLWNMVFSGIWFFLYNELATITIAKTNAVTQSVLNTAKRVIVIVVVAMVMGESLGFLKLLGSAIGIAGVFLYSIIDKLVAKPKEPEKLQ